MRALDLFSGTGWGVACQRLGIDELGVDINGDVIDTRALNMMRYIHADVLNSALLYSHKPDILIASPPCPTFSSAGKRVGNNLVGDVCAAIEMDAVYHSLDAVRRFGMLHDPRSALVMAPLSYIFHLQPDYVVLEQVEAVLPVWESYAKEMRRWGYTTETGILHAEQFGVPQTRKRAFLVASKGAASLPEPTHSKFYSNEPERLDEGVLPWVSMADCLGWGRSDAPCHTITAGTHGPTDRWASGSNFSRKKMDAAMLTDAWVPGGEKPITSSRQKYHVRIDAEDASRLQTYPEGFRWCGNKSQQFLQIGNAVPPLWAEAVLKTLIS